MIDTGYQEAVSEARDLGKDAALSAASWVIDGASRGDVKACGRLLQMMRDGDPASEQYLPVYPNLSGEFADDPTPARIFEEIIGRPPELEGLDVESRDGALIDSLCDAWEEGVSETFEPECERLLIAYIAS